QRRQGDVTVGGSELGDGLDEQIEVVASRRSRRTDGGGQLDVDATGVDDAPYQVEQWLVRVGTEPPKFSREQRETLPRSLGVVMITRIVKRIAQLPDLRGIGAG